MFKLGDHVIMLYSSISGPGYQSNSPKITYDVREGDRAEIIEISNVLLNRYKVRLKNTKNVIGNLVEKWVSPYDFKIDKQYNRNEKINTILSNSNNSN